MISLIILLILWQLRSVMLRSPLLFLFLTSVPFIHAQSNLENQVYYWENNFSAEEIQDEITLLKYKKGDENKILILESISAQHHNNTLRRVEILKRLSEKTDFTSNYYSIYSNYNLAVTLNSNNAPLFALEYLDKAITHCKKSNNKRFLYLSCRTKANILCKLHFFDKACSYFLDAARSHGNTNKIEQALDYNSLALCYMELKQYSKAIRYFELGMNRIDKNNPEQRETYYLIKGNIGSAYVKLGELKKGKDYLHSEINFYRSANIKNDNYTMCLSQIIKIEEFNGNSAQVQRLCRELFKSINNKGNLDNRFNAIELLIDVSNRTPLGISETDINKLHDQILTAQLTKNEKNVNPVITNPSETITTAERKEIERWKFTAVLLISFLFLLLVIIVYIFIVIKRKNISETPEKYKQRPLEKEIESQKEQLNILLNTLRIKQRTEAGFAEKIKRLKSNKRVSTDELINELQIGLANLLEIDKKLATELKLDTDIKIDHINVLRETHPNLTRLEIKMCSYFISGLSAKEIGLLLNMSDVSVRVAKNKIKKKIGISKNLNLNDYLQSIC